MNNSSIYNNTLYLLVYEIQTVTDKLMDEYCELLFRDHLPTIHYGTTRFLDFVHRPYSKTTREHNVSETGSVSVLR
jgi:hypothetical protein